MNRRILSYLDFFCFIYGWKLRRNFSRRNKTMAECTKELQRRIVCLDKQGRATHRDLWNAGLYINVVSHDLSIIMFDIARERNEWKRLYLARALALVLYEIEKDIPIVLGKDFQRAMSDLSVPVEMKSRLNEEKNRFSEFKRLNKDVLYEIRNYVAGHRKHDAMEQLRVIDGIDILDIQNLGIELGSYLNDLGTIMHTIMTFTAEAPDKNT